ncbi:MAG: type II toxin-antitoxin system prevent-host-death family antitoxin [Acidobacteriaceae bacterium]
MKTAGSFYVKTHLSALLEEVQQGEVIEITNRGKPVARIIPIKNDEEKKARAQEALKYFLSLERKPLPKGMDYSDLVKAGRKH